MRKASLLAVVLGAACGQGAPVPARGPVARVVGLAPSATEIVFALGAGDRVVGVCAQCDYPAEAASRPRVGGYLTPSVEPVLATQPDLVIAVPSPGNREAVRAIERAGVRILVVQDRALADLWASIEAIATALGMPESGIRLAAELHAKLEIVRARASGRPRPKVLLVVGHSPLIVAGGATLQSELLEIAGGVNVAADIGTAFPQVSLEVVVDRAPDVILDAAMGTEGGGRELFAKLVTVPAVRDGRVVHVASDALYRTGPRVTEAVEIVAAAIGTGGRPRVDARRAP